jgi:hypothetical protein
MGDCAQYALNQWIKNGMPDNTPRKKIIRVICPDCGKEVHGQAALMQHQNKKHCTKHSFVDICNVRDSERYDL